MVTAVDGPTITYDGRGGTVDNNRESGIVKMVLRFVDRKQFSAVIENQSY